MKRFVTLAASLIAAAMVMCACGSGQSAQPAAPAQSETQEAESAETNAETKEETTPSQETETEADAETASKETEAASEEEIEVAETEAAETEAAEPDNPYAPGDSIDKAAMIPVNTRISGTATDAKIWYYAFETSDNEDNEYMFSAVNKTPDSKYLGFVLCDENERQIEYVYANGLGTATSFARRKLAPNTVYYLKVYSNKANNHYDLSETEIDYAFFVRDLTDKSLGTLWGSGIEETETADTEEKESTEVRDYSPGTNQDEAAMIPINKKITGIAEDAAIWYYAFRTTDNGEHEYEFSAINKTKDSKYLGFVLCDEGGSQIDYVYADTLGTATCFRRNLRANTVYYLKVYSNKANNHYDLSETPVEYAFSVRDVSDRETGALWGDGARETDTGPSEGTPENEAKEYAPGTNQDAPALIPINTKITGTAEDAAISYYSFRTVDQAEHEYEFSAVNKTRNSKYLGFVLCDEGGRQIDYVYADALGSATSFRRKLPPDTVYYLKVYSNKANNHYELNETPVEYAFSVRDISDKSVDALWGDGSREVGDAASFSPGSNQDEPAMLPLNKRLAGSATNGLIWYFSFRTVENAEGIYDISFLNKTPDSRYLGVVLCDEGGRQIEYKYAEPSETDTQFSCKLPPDTVYYLKVYSNKANNHYELDETAVDYELSVHTDIPEDVAAPVVTIVEEPEPEETVDELPFGVAMLQEEENNPVGYTVGDLIDLGFETDEDVAVPVQSRVVCDEFIMTKEGVPFTVRAVNPYAEEIPLNDCIVCYFGISDTTGIVTIDGDISCGSTVRDEVVARYSDPLTERETYVVYQTQNPERDYGTEYGNFVISEDVQTCDVLFRFDEGGVLSETVFLAPYLLYNTLTENLENVDFGTADPVALDEALEVRDDILGRLKAAFDKEGINVAIDEETGKITLDNSILFDFDSYRLSESGQAYIDSFLRAYAEALLDGEHTDQIKTVEFAGHTDTDGSYEYNQKLSENRANEVLSYCSGSNKAGLSSEQAEIFGQIATAVGYSFDDPVYGEDGKVDMDASRRVEIRFFLNLDE